MNVLHKIELEYSFQCLGIMIWVLFFVDTILSFFSKNSCYNVFISERRSFMKHIVTDFLIRYGIHSELHLLDCSDSQSFTTEFKDNVLKLYINPSKYPDIDAALFYMARNALIPHLCLETERLILRHFQKGDAEHLFESMSDKETCAMDGGYDPESSLDETYIASIDEFIQDPHRFVIALKTSNQAIGMLHLMPVNDRQVEAMEIGYLINPSQRRKGYAKEAVSAMIRFLMKEGKLDLILLGACEKNTASLSMIQKLGFTFEGRKHKAFWDVDENKPVDLLYYYLDRKESDMYE